jgi:hypothetical protein
VNLRRLIFFLVKIE